MNVKPILFNAEMVQAIIEGRKTMTRRVIQNQEGIRPRWNNIGWAGWDDGHGRKMRQPFDSGDILWVRETCYYETHMGASAFIYKADWPDYPVDVGVGEYGWTPSIHMPKEAARIFLRVTDVRAERVREITLDDIEREGLYCDPPYTREHFAYGPGMSIHWVKLWDSIYAKRGHGWDTNPWVWVYTFERTDKPAGWPDGEAES